MVKLQPRSLLPRKKVEQHLEADLTKLLDLLEEENKDELPIKKTSNTAWTKLFEGLRFFPRFHHFIKIDILSHTEVENFKWVSYVET